MAKKPKKIKLTPTRSGAQIYMSDDYAKEFSDGITSGVRPALRNLITKNLREKMYAEGATPQEVGEKRGDILVDQINESVRVLNKKKKKKRGASGKAKGGAVRAMKLGGAVMKGRGPKFKGQS